MTRSDSQRRSPCWVRAGRAVSLALLLAGSLTLFSCAPRSKMPTADARLQSLWASYLQNYVSPQGYVRDPSRDGGRVTSEGQSYALLQAAWLRDRVTFERVLLWTNQHLRRDDGLYSWLFDPSAGGIVDANTATDADTDIAFALIIASHAFQHPEYQAQARELIRSIRTRATLSVGPDWFPSAGNWAGAERIANLSYFAPYAYEYFERLDPGAGWSRAIVVGYDLLEQATRGATSRLPADFVTVTPEGRLAALPATSTLSRVFSFDAVRIFWRVDVDCRLFARSAACGTDQVASRIEALLQRDGRLLTRYATDGTPKSSDQSASLYGALLPMMSRARPALAAEWRRSQLSDKALDTLRAAHNRYYDANWIWFGFAASDGFVVTRTPRLASLRARETITPTDSTCTDDGRLS